VKYFINLWQTLTLTVTLTVAFDSTQNISPSKNLNLLHKQVANIISESLTEDVTDVASGLQLSTLVYWFR